MAEIKEENEFLVEVDIEAAEQSRLPWNMLEHNQIPELLPFQYYYKDNKVCFQYLTKELQPVSEYFQKKDGDFETLFFLCAGVIKIVEQGEEYLLKPEEYILKPERIYWSRREKRLGLCYLPGNHGNIKAGYTVLVEYLLQHTEHRDEQAVKFIYGLYDTLTSDCFSVEALGKYFAEYNKASSPKEKKISCKTEGRKEKYYLAYCGKLWEEVPFQQEGIGVYPVPEQEEVLVGRDKEGDIVLPCPEISRKQAVLYQKGHQLFLSDRNSTNGTYLNEKIVSSQEKLSCEEGDYIRFANRTFQLVCHRVNKR